MLQVVLHSNCASIVSDYSYEWKKLKGQYSEEAVAALVAEFERYSVCPQTEGELGEVWRPFEEHISIYEAWKAYHDYQQSSRMFFPLEECGCPSMIVLTSNRQDEQLACVYQGIAAGRMSDASLLECSYMGVFFLENEWRPVAEVSRFKITEIPLKVLVAISGIWSKYQMLGEIDLGYLIVNKCGNCSFKEWREVRIPHLKKLMDINQESFFAERMQFLKEPLKAKDNAGVYSYI